MGFQIVSNKVLQDGKEVDGGSSHADGVRAARDRAKSSTTATTAPGANVSDETWSKAFPKNKKKVKPDDEPEKKEKS